MNVTVVGGDILDQDVEDIVNAWNRNIIPWWLLVPQGVSGAIKKRGGLQPFHELGTLDSRLGAKRNSDREKPRLQNNGPAANWRGLWWWQIIARTIDHRRRGDQMTIRWRGANRPVLQNADEQSGEREPRMSWVLESKFFGGGSSTLWVY